MQSLSSLSFSALLDSCNAIRVYKSNVPRAAGQKPLWIDSIESILSFARRKTTARERIVLGRVSRITYACAQLSLETVATFATKLRRAYHVEWVDPFLVAAMEHAPLLKQKGLFDTAVSLAWPRPLVAPELFMSRPANLHYDQRQLAKAYRSRASPTINQLDKELYTDGFLSAKDLVLHRQSIPNKYPVYVVDKTCFEACASSEPHIVAKESIASETIRRALESSDTCIICFDLDANLVLECSHSMCVSCLRNIQSNSSIVCPFCKRKQCVGRAYRSVRLSSNSKTYARDKLQG